MNSQALVTLDQFGFLSITGRDAEKFLQGYTTCDLTRLTQGMVMRGAICNIKGRMVSNFLAIRTNEGFLLRLHRDLVESTSAFLAKYIVFSKAEIKDQSAELHCYGATSEGLADVDVDLPQEPGAIADSDHGQILKVASDRFEIWSQKEVPATAEQTEWQRAELAEGIIWVDSVTSGAFIPQMFNLHNIEGISFEKGCYLGQEIVARMQYRGELKNRLHLAELDEVSELKVGAKIQSEGKKVGEVVAVAGSLAGFVLKAGETAYQLENETVTSPTEVAEAPE